MVLQTTTHSVLNERHDTIFTHVSVCCSDLISKAVDITTERIDNNEIRIKIDDSIFDNEVDLQTVVVFA